MSISSEISRIQQNVDDAFTEIALKLGTPIPADRTSDDLAHYISEIPTGGVVVTETQDSHGGSIVSIESTNAFWFNWMGETPEFVSTLGTVNWTLDNTTYSSWTPTTDKATTIKATTNLTTFSAAMTTYDYVILWEVEIKPAYLTGATDITRPIRNGYYIASWIYKRPSNYANLNAGTYNSNAVESWLIGFEDYYNASGVRAIAYAPSYGIYSAATAPTFSSSTSNTPTVTVKTPTVAARCSTTYFSTGNAGYIDTTNSTIKMTAKLYRLPVGKGWRRKMYTDFFGWFKGGI